MKNFRNRKKIKAAIFLIIAIIGSYFVLFGGRKIITYAAGTVVDIGVFNRRDISPNGRIDQTGANGAFDAFCKLATGDGSAAGTCSSAPYSWGPYDCWNGSFFYQCGGGSGFKSGACEIVRCTYNLNGNGILDPGEQCDDGNIIDGDGCSSSGQIETIVNNKFTDTTLKPFNNTAEVLVFKPSLTVTQPQNYLLKGIAEISDDGGKIWGRSIAEILYVGATPVLISLDKSDGVNFINAGSETEYTVKFGASGFDFNDSITSVQLTDTLSTNDPTQDGKVKIIEALYCGDDDTCSNPVNIPFGANGFTYNTPSIDVRMDHYIKVKIQIDPDIKPAIKVINKADISIHGITQGDIDEDMILNPFVQENKGGDIYARGNVKMNRPVTGNNDNAQYIIGSDGNITSTKSAFGPLLEQYSMRKGSGSYLGLDQNECVGGSVCDLMKKGIEKAKNNARRFTGNLGNNLNPNKIPEGEVWYYKGDLVIGSGTVLEGRGTIIVEGNLRINSNVNYRTDKDIVGFVIVGGDVVISPSVENVKGIFYISDGSFKTGSGDKQLTVEGLVVAKGFDLGRSYTGIEALQTVYSLPNEKSIVPDGRVNQLDFAGFNAFCKIKSGSDDAVGVCSDNPYAYGKYDRWDSASSRFVFDSGDQLSRSGACEQITCIASQKPAEIFSYDGRILFTPPPLFGNKVLKALY